LSQIAQNTKKAARIIGYFYRKQMSKIEGFGPAQQQRTGWKLRKIRVRHRHASAAAHSKDATGKKFGWQKVKSQMSQKVESNKSAPNIKFNGSVICLR
jgi:hypothetical protein